ncbi:MAG: glycosyltransferase family 2 protein [Nitrospira sp.]|nr:glycosyltransferase family 2 protein [Candidatus Manganitrophaceae bacterium]HIL35451.1 glycosyltransferase family 2 protein [Candidatus Manganitrophaceae bacterium]
MLQGKKIGVVIPAHDEEKLIGRVIETMPSFVDRIIIVDDLSSDKTVAIVEGYVMKAPEENVLIQHKKNMGVGGAVATGYKRALSEKIDVVVVMNGDAQMDPADLKRIVSPIIRGESDYVKGNRLFRGESWEMIPHYRYLGNSVLSLLTKVASGYWHIADSQSGYTAISLIALRALNLDAIYLQYGMPNDILIKLNICNFRVKDVSVRPIYNIGEKSGIRIWKVIPSISWLLLKGFIKRMLQKYVIQDFHPLVFFYFLGLSLTPTGFFFGAYLICLRLSGILVMPTEALFASFLFISGLQSLFFAMWFDMEYNKHLRGPGR